jgi:hypothetical protein
MIDHGPGHSYARINRTVMSLACATDPRTACREQDRNSWKPAKNRKFRREAASAASKPASGEMCQFFKKKRAHQN